MASIIAVLRGLVLAGITLVLGACAAGGPYNGYVSGGEEDAKDVREGKYSEAAMAQIAIVQNPDINGGLVSPKALRKIQEYGLSCQRQVDAQVAGAAKSAAGGALSYGAAGLVGTGVAADAAFHTGVKAGQYGVYGGVTYFFSGAVNGLVTGSYAMASAKGTCTRDFWSDVSKSDPDFRGTHVVVVYAGKAWNSTPPALNRSAAARPPALSNK